MSSVDSVEYGLVGGWLREEEDYDFLGALPDSNTEELKAMRTWAAPESVDPREWLQVEDQRRLGSCQGHALSTCVELAYNFEAKDIIQFSRMYGYIRTQQIDGIRGDRGSTISGGAKCAKEGLCLESTWPYTGQYTYSIPEAAKEEAKKYRIASAVNMRSYDDIFEFLASCVGGINIGLGWSLPNKAIHESYRRGGGGHAVGLVGYSTRKDAEGRNYIIQVNSWGRGWGDNGFSEWSPNMVNQVLRAGATAIGLSDMVDIKPRKPKYRFL